VIVMSATMARVTTTMVMMRLDVDGIVNVIRLVLPCALAQLR
jgi:hypothetical protein